MKKTILILLAVVGAFVAYLMLKQDDPVTTAKLKCEFGIEQATNYDLSIMDVSRSTVSGDVFNGTVTMPFTVGGQKHFGECVFRDGRYGRITVDGKLLAGRP